MNDEPGAVPAPAPQTASTARTGIPRSRRIALRVAIGVAVALVLFAVLGFLVAPPIARHQLERILGEQLHRPVTIERVRINPFALSASVEKLAVAAGATSDAAASPLLTFDALHLDVSSSSIWRLAPVIQRVRLARPHLRLVRHADGKYNVQDLIDEATAPKPEPADPGGPPKFAVFNIEVDDGRIDFDDQPEKTQHAITELRIGVPFLSSIPSQVDITVQPELRAKVNGAPIGLAGATKPFKDTRETTVSLDLQDLQIAKYIEYSPVPLQARVPSGALDTKLTLSLATQQERLQTLTVTGSARVRDLVVQQPDGAPLMAAKSLDVDLDGLDLVARRVGIKRVGVEKPDVRVVLRKDGSINLLGIVGSGSRSPKATDKAARPVESKAEGKADHKSTNTPAGAAADATPFVVRVDAVDVSGGTVRFIDETTDKPFESRLGNVSASVDTLVLNAPPADKPKPAALKVSFDVEPKGRFSYAGTLEPAPLKTEGELALDGIRIAAFAPYYSPFVDIVVTGGQLATKGALAVDMGAQPARVAYRGNVAVAGFSSLDGPTSQELLRWKSLQVANVDFNLEPMTVAVGQVTLADFYSRLIVNADGTLNLQGLVKKQEGASADTPGRRTGEQQASADSRSASGEKPATVRIGRIQLKGGHVNFSDYFVKPNYSAELQGLTGTVSEMNPTTPGDVELRARIGATAPVEIVGRINPLARDLFLDIDANARDVELPGLSPYSVKYAGYGIEKGKLSLKVKYQLENRQLKAENNIRLDQLTFGQRVESPTATQLPVLLAVALLKDRNGVIDVDLPISGSLDDPQFSIGGVIVRVIVNLITKAVTAPFALLGALFGGGEELAYAEFRPGTARVAEADGSKLKTLAKALEERPALKIDVAGRVDPDADREALKRVMLERQLKAMKLRGAGGAKSAAGTKPGASAQPPPSAKPPEKPTGDARPRADGGTAGGSKPGPIPLSEARPPTAAKPSGDGSAAEGDVDALDDVTLEPAEYERLLAAMVRGASGAPAAAGRPATPGSAKPGTAPAAPSAAPSRAELEQQALARITVSDDDLQALASARAQNVKAWFVDIAKIAPDRIFVVAPRLSAEGIKDGGKASRVDFAVK